MVDALSEIFEETEFRSIDLAGVDAPPESLFNILESQEDDTVDLIPFSPFEEPIFSPIEEPSQASNSSNAKRPSKHEKEAGFLQKKIKLSTQALPLDVDDHAGHPKMSHITVERNRRKQMKEHLSVLRSLIPGFYVKRGDQASVIGGVVDYIKELQQVLQSLEAKKQRKVYSEVLSPRPTLSPRPPALPLSPRPSPLCSPRTPQQGSPYKPRAYHGYVLSPSNMASSHEPSPSFEAPLTELSACSKTQVANVEVKFSGPNVLLRVVSILIIAGQAVKIVALLEGLDLEILHVSISMIEDAMVFSFTIKIGIECGLSAEELAQEVQQTFSYPSTDLHQSIDEKQ